MTDTLYRFRFFEYQKAYNAPIAALPLNIQELISKAYRCFDLLSDADHQTQNRLLFILAGTDAIICAAIYSLYHDPAIPEPTTVNPAKKIDKAKQLALRAKALKMKWASGND